MTAENAPAVSVVVPVYNAAATLARTFRALSGQTLTGPFEVIVVDGGSIDGTLELIETTRAARPPFELLLHHNPAREPASSRNIGVQTARAPVIAFTDADCEPAPQWLAAGLQALEHADIVQGAVRPVRERGPFDRSLWIGKQYGLYETANLLVRREWLQRVGGFERLPGLELPPGKHFGEDTWFGWRAAREGARIAFCEDALVRHAVFDRGPREFIAEQRRRDLFPVLVAQIPELRDVYLHRHWFLNANTLAFDVAAGGALAGLLIAASHRPPAGTAVATAATLPYLTRLAKRTKGAPPRIRLEHSLILVAADAVSLRALVAGSVRNRTVVL